MRIALLGGTDLTQAVADLVAPHLAGVVSIAPTIPISFSPGGLRNARFSDVGQWAVDHGIPSLRWSGVDSLAEFLDSIEADWGLAAGWYYLLPQRILDRFPLGCAGVHASLLPRYRGNAPLNWVILNGEAETGVSLFRLTAGMDEGPLYGQEAIPIHARASVRDLVDAAQAATLRLVAEAVDAFEQGASTLRSQEGTATYALARLPEDGRIDWSWPATRVDRLVRATTRPYPGAFTALDERSLYIWSGEPLTSPVVFGTPGQLWYFDKRVVVVTGEGLYAIDDATTESGEDALLTLRRSSHRRFDGPALSGDG